jgi:ubiquinone/menaquinone biosynthesis C-methylase UbiE
MHRHIHTSESPAQTEGRLIGWASFYDVLANILTLGQVGRLRQVTIDQALLQPGETLLDVGCGTGGVTIPAKLRLGEQGSAAGIDPSAAMIAIARRKAQRAGVEIDFRIGVIESLPFPDEVFDVITASLMMHHLPGHLQGKGLTEIWRVLRPSGRILIADMTRPGTASHKRSFRTLPLHYGHGAQFDIEDLCKPLADARFEKVEQPDAHFLAVGFLRATKPGP